MKRKLIHGGLSIACFCVAAVLPLQAHASQCSLSSVAGNWSYTYNGTVFVPQPLPVASVGSVHLDAKGNVNGTQTHTLAGQTEVENISGTYTVNGNCTGTFSVNVYVNGQLLRSATLNTTYDTNINHARMIFTSLTVADGTVLPAVITMESNRVFSED